MASKFDTFIFETYSFDFSSGKLTLNYRYDKEHAYQETVDFDVSNFKDNATNRELIEHICFYIFVVAGTSYYKIYAPKNIEFEEHALDAWQAGFFNMIYKGGLSQFVYENKLKPDNLAEFSAGKDIELTEQTFDDEGILLMQSGGKDSLLSSELLRLNGKEFTSWHMSSTGKYPKVLDKLNAPVVATKRNLNVEKIKTDEKDGGMNGHIPFSALYAGFGLLQSVLSGNNIVVASNEASADQANVVIDGYEVNHQYSKTFKVEIAIQEYIHRYISKDLQYVSLLRPFDELRVGELFAKYVWPIHKNDFSSCNLANYKQGEDRGNLTWDGTCPKCANTFLLLAPFVDKHELLNLFEGKNLLIAEDMEQTYLQLFGFADIKPFECVGTFEEMKYAYTLAVMKDNDYKNKKFHIDNFDLDYKQLGNRQPIADKLLNYFAV